MAKDFTFYVVSNSTSKPNDLTFAFNVCTVVTSKAQAEDFIISRSIMKHIDHYQQWAEIHHKNILDPATKKEYARKVLPSLLTEEDKYTIGKMKYKIEGLAAVLRMFNGCTPVGASYETPAEILYFGDLYKEYLENKKKES